MLAFAGPLAAMPPDTLSSVVSVLPQWPGRAQGGTGAPAGAVPEGSGVALRPGVVATAWHVVEPADRIEVRFADGRVLPARLIARDAASDIALLGVDAELVPFVLVDDPALADPVCSIGNAFGLGLSVTCGVVSATQVSNAGFNAVEDFIQTDAAINPGMSGGALVDRQGRLIGMTSAIFASEGDTNTGVGFAVSAVLLERVTEALLADGRATYPVPGWRLALPDRDQLRRVAAPVIVDVQPGAPADIAGVLSGDLVVTIGDRRVRSPRDAISALGILPEGTESVEVKLLRDGAYIQISLKLDSSGAAVATAPDPSGDCPYPAPVCVVRQAVFPVSGFDPAASATRIGPDLLVTNRHVVGDLMDAVVYTPAGPRDAQVVPSDYQGDLVLLKVGDLPDAGHIPALDQDTDQVAQFYAVGADISRQEVRVFRPGTLIAGPAPGAELGRIHVTTHMQPGVSGGALVDAEGRLAGIAVGGGEGRYEAIPLEQLRHLLAGRSEDVAAAMTEALGRAFADCAGQIDDAERGGRIDTDSLVAICSVALNHGQLLEAGRILARTGDFDGAATLHGQAVRQVPNSINARLSLLVSMQLGARFEEMTAHARWLMAMVPEDPQALRIAIQSGVWGGAPDLAEEAYRLLLEADPRQAQAARRFIDNAPPAPRRRR